MTGANDTGTLSTIAFCWTIERSDGAGLALTSHDRDLTVNGQLHRAQPGMMPAAIEKQLGLGEADGEISVAVTSAALSAADLSSGRWDGARVELCAVDWLEPTNAIPLVAGALGEIDVRENAFSAGLRGAAASLSKPVCPTTSSECRAELGDRQCRVDMAGRKAIVRVVAAEGRMLSVEPTPEPGFLWGSVRILTGANTGMINATVGLNGAMIELRDLPFEAIEAGTLLRLQHGCDKRFATCKERFANTANFRGEPHLPGNDLLTRFPGG